MCPFIFCILKRCILILQIQELVIQLIIVFTVHVNRGVTRVVIIIIIIIVITATGRRLLLACTIFLIFVLDRFVTFIEFLRNFCQTSYLVYLHQIVVEGKNALCETTKPRLLLLLARKLSVNHSAVKAHDLR